MLLALVSACGPAMVTASTCDNLHGHLASQAVAGDAKACGVSRLSWTWPDAMAHAGSRQGELFGLLEHEHLAGAAILVMANKQDLKDAMSVEELTQTLALHAIKRHDWHIQARMPLLATSWWHHVPTLGLQTWCRASAQKGSMRDAPACRLAATQCASVCT